VLISPRRYGKTSLVQRVQHALSIEGHTTIYVDFYGVTSIEDVASRIATNIYRATYSKTPLFERAVKYLSNLRPRIGVDVTSPKDFTFSLDVAKGKSGKELLEGTMDGLGRFIQDSKKSCLVAIDEFQEMTELSDGLFIEGTMRSHIQHHSNASYFFVGSRRRILADMFNNRDRAFYKSAINVRLPVFPEDDLIEFLIERFDDGGKKCSIEAAKLICDLIQKHPYYSQKLAYHVHEISGEEIAETDVQNGFLNLMEDERDFFEVMIQGLGSRQIALLSAIAEEPTCTPYAQEYISNHGLGSAGTVQGGIKKLVSLDYIEQVDGKWRVVDTVFGAWLRKR